MHQKLVMALDLAGWEQDGKRFRFIKVASGEIKTFKNWTEVYNFCLEIYKK